MFNLFSFSEVARALQPLLRSQLASIFTHFQAEKSSCGMQWTCSSQADPLVGECQTNHRRMTLQVEHSGRFPSRARPAEQSVYPMISGWLVKFMFQNSGTCLQTVTGLLGQPAQQIEFNSSCCDLRKAQPGPHLEPPAPGLKDPSLHINTKSAVRYPPPSIPPIITNHQWFLLLSGVYSLYHMTITPTLLQPLEEGNPSATPRSVDRTSDPSERSTQKQRLPSGERSTWAQLLGARRSVADRPWGPDAMPVSELSNMHRMDGAYVDGPCVRNPREALA